MRTVALDIGRAKSAFCEVADGQVIRRDWICGEADWLRLLGPNTEPCRVVLEACREAWHLSDMLESYGHEVTVADTTRVREIGVGRHGRKTDRLDAERLAIAHERGMISAAHVLSPSRRALRHELLVRRGLVETRASLVTQVRGLVRAHGQKLGRAEVERFHLVVAQAKLSEPLHKLIAPLLTALVTVQQQIAIVDERLNECAKNEPAAAALVTMPGVGTVVALGFISVIDAPQRFKNAHQVASYLGLVPRETSSGGTKRLGHISRAGNGFVRALLVQAAWCILRARNEHPLTQWAKTVSERRGKKIAALAVARRIAAILWAIMRDGTVYDPASLGVAMARGVRLESESQEHRARALEEAARKLRRRAGRQKPKLDGVVM